MKIDTSLWPPLRPNKPERTIIHCPICFAQLLVGKYGSIPTCKCQEKKP
jgi:hypothetical protein